jgi:hypothetical protein
VDGRDYLSVFDQEDAGEVAALDGGDGEVNDLLQGCFDTAGGEQGASGFREVVDERRGGIGELDVGQVVSIGRRRVDRTNSAYPAGRSRMRPSQR